MTHDQIKNRISETLSQRRLEVGTKARVMVDMIEGALGLSFGLDLRAKLEEIFLHGLSANHIDQAAELVEQYHPGLIASSQKGIPNV